MSAVLERAMAHFSAQERQSIIVPEWGDEGKPLIIYFAAMSVFQKRRIYKPGTRPSDDPSIQVDAVIEMAQTEDGKQLFTLDDREKLLREVDARVVRRVATAIFSASLGAEQVEKN